MHLLINITLNQSLQSIQNSVYQFSMISVCQRFSKQISYLIFREYSTHFYQFSYHTFFHIMFIYFCYVSDYYHPFVFVFVSADLLLHFNLIGMKDLSSIDTVRSTWKKVSCFSKYALLKSLLLGNSFSSAFRYITDAWSILTCHSSALLLLTKPAPFSNLVTSLSNSSEAWNLF